MIVRNFPQTFYINLIKSMIVGFRRFLTSFEMTPKRCHERGVIGGFAAYYPPLTRL
jgi:hypothetical protein